MALIREILFVLFLGLFLSGITAAQMEATLPITQKGAGFFPTRAIVPPSAPGKQHNSVPRLRSIPATKA
ncbi:hypothetical protein NC652_030252 [Populus alba x Populus x berolinensis]|nr:hypothetical protein NC652_030252 [Populus alba x Populus x berolinensis]